MNTVNKNVSGRLTTRDITYIGIFAALMGVCSWISIPAPVPFTLQTMGVFLSLWILGGKRGTMAITCYILMGAVGLPMFSGMTGGMSIIMGSTGGYIVGFLASALLYWLVTSAFGNSRAIKIIAMVMGLIACYALGTVWFMQVYMRTKGAVSVLSVLGWCVFPFVVPDLLKIALAVSLGKRLEKQIR